MISRKVYFLLWRNPHRRKPPVGATDRGFPTMGKLVLEAYACTIIPSGDRLMGSVFRTEICGYGYMLKDIRR